MINTYCKAYRQVWLHNSEHYYENIEIAEII